MFYQRVTFLTVTSRYCLHKFFPLIITETAEVCESRHQLLLLDGRQLACLTGLPLVLIRAMCDYLWLQQKKKQVGDTNMANLTGCRTTVSECGWRREGSGVIYCSCLTLKSNNHSFKNDRYFVKCIYEWGK